MQKRLAQIKGIQEVSTDLQISNPQLSLHILRDKAAALGITPAKIEATLYNAYGSNQISTIYAASNEYSIIAGLDPQFQFEPDSLNKLYIRSSNGKLISLNAIAKIDYTAAAAAVNHYEQLPSVIFSFNLLAGVALSDVSNKITAAAKEVLPANISGKLVGTAEVFTALASSMPILLLMTILVIFSTT